MQIVLVSNFMNHHQLPFSNEMLAVEGVDYWFVATEEIPLERINMGYYDMNSYYPFIIKAYEDREQKEKALRLCAKADVVIYGSAPYEFIKLRLKNKMLTFKYSERIYKKKLDVRTIPLRFIKYYWENTRHKNLYLLCSSAYVSYDYSKTRTFIGKCYKWGYFPQTYIYDNIEEIIDSKKKNSILWAGRLIDWKHPEAVIEIAKRLRKTGTEFQINVIGTGIMEHELLKIVKDERLDDYIHFQGSMSPEEVRKYMLNSQIFLFTSDRKEGWGAVLNEAMNSGCSVVASNAIGAVPYLVKDKKNGLIYQSEDIDALYRNVRYLLDNPSKQKQLGVNAYQTIKDTWNAEVAAKRFVQLSIELMEQKKKCNLYKDGPCSKAEIIRG